MHIIFDESAPSSPLVGLTEPRSTHPTMQCRPRLGNKNWTCSRVGGRILSNVAIQTPDQFSFCIGAMVAYDHV
jgi:hypothetical protein